MRRASYVVKPLWGLGVLVASLGIPATSSSSVALRVLDARLVGEATGHVVDRLDQRFDFGVLLSSGVIFK